MRPVASTAGKTLKDRLSASRHGLRGTQAGIESLYPELRLPTTIAMRLWVILYQTSGAHHPYDESTGVDIWQQLAKIKT